MADLLLLTGSRSGRPTVHRRSCSRRPVIRPGERPSRVAVGELSKAADYGWDLCDRCLGRWKAALKKRTEGGPQRS